MNYPKWGRKPRAKSGDLSGWKRPEPEQQLVLTLLQPTSRARAIQRELDWGNLEDKLQEFLLLPKPISVLEAGRRLNVEARQLYLRANKTTRQLGERWKTYLRRRQEEHVVNAWPYLEQAVLTSGQREKQSRGGRLPHECRPRFWRP